MKRMLTRVIQKDRFLVLEQASQQETGNENQSEADMAAKPTYSYLQAGPKFVLWPKKGFGAKKELVT